MKTIRELIIEFNCVQDCFLKTNSNKDLNKLYLILNDYLKQVIKAKIQSGKLSYSIDLNAVAHTIASDTVSKYQTNKDQYIKYMPSYFNQAIFNTIYYQKKIDKKTIKENTIEDLSEKIIYKTNIEEMIINKVKEDEIIKKIEEIIDFETKKIEDPQLYNRIIKSIINCVGRKKSYESYMYKLNSKEKKVFKRIMINIREYLHVE